MLNEVIFETKFIWEDVLGCMNEKSRDYFLQLPENIQQMIVDEKTHSLRKGLESGIMYDWDIVMKTAIDNADLFSEVEDYDETEE